MLMVNNILANNNNKNITSAEILYSCISIDGSGSGSGIAAVDMLHGIGHGSWRTERERESHRREEAGGQIARDSGKWSEVVSLNDGRHSGAILSRCWLLADRPAGR